MLVSSQIFQFFFAAVPYFAHLQSITIGNTDILMLLSWCMCIFLHVDLGLPPTCYVIREFTEYCKPYANLYSQLVF